MTEIDNLEKEYYDLLIKQDFIEEDLDYSLFNKQKPFLEKLATVNNSGITVFDLYKKEHIFVSYNFSDIFGYDLNKINEQATDYFNSRVHPDDFLSLTKNGILIIKSLYTIPIKERINYKFVNEYRIIGNTGDYIRVIEQHQALEVDRRGNIWLALGIIDISPDQTIFNGVKSQIINFKSGEFYSVNFKISDKTLSKREIEVLGLIKSGLLSKEISEKLSISVHTVNTHRQRILGKLGANNSLEATAFAEKLGLI